MTTIPQIRAARGLLGWSQTKLAEEASLSLPTVKRYETGSALRVSGEAVTAMRAALESAGVIFVAENGEGPGVRLRKTPESAADLTHRIDTIEAGLAETEGPSPQTPAGGMRTLERAYKRETVKKLKNRRTKLKK